MASVILIMIDEKQGGVDISTQLAYNDRSISNSEKKLAHELQVVIEKFLEQNIIAAEREAEKRKQERDTR